MTQLLFPPDVLGVVRGMGLWFALLAVLFAASGASAADGSALCPPAHPRLVVADSRAHVYSVPRPHAIPGGRPLPGTIRGCALGHRRVVVLGLAPFGTAREVGGVYSATLAGTIVAYEQFREVFGPEQPLSDLVVVRDLRTGRLLHRVPTGTSAPTGPAAKAIVVKSDGAVAWIVDTAGGYQVRAVDRTGSHVVAIGSDIAPGSLIPSCKICPVVLSRYSVSEPLSTGL